MPVKKDDRVNVKLEDGRTVSGTILGFNGPIVRVQIDVEVDGANVVQVLQDRLSLPS